jgi:FAD/FMN-containing dehydrogenase
LAERLQATLAGAAESGAIQDAALASTPSQLSQLWALRENVSEAERLAGQSAKHDVAVAVSDVPAFLEAAEAAVRALSARLEVNAFGHLGDGNIHFNVLIHDAGMLTEEVNRVVHDVVARFDGSIAAEHGIGQYRVGELLRLRSHEEIATMRRLKGAFDPEGVLNPGKVLPSEPS